MTRRWCCTEFKESKSAGKVTLVGVRNEESAKRSKRKEVEISRHAFAGTLNQLDAYRDSLKDKKWLRKDRIQTEPNGEQTISCIHGKETLIISPIIHWSVEDVWDFLGACSVPHCCLYDQGNHRIGCLLCPMSSKRQKLEEISRYPHIKRNWIKAINQIRKKSIPEGSVWYNLRLCDIAQFLPPTPTDDDIAEVIMDWWISQKSMKQWIAERSLPQLPFAND